MLRNYFKTAWRNLVKNPLYSFINIAGLTVGLAVGMLIMLWIRDELKFDSFYKKTADIYKLENQVGTGASIQIWQSTAAPIGIMAKNELPEVKEAARLMYNNRFLLFKYQEKLFNEQRTLFADPSLFSVFDFDFVQGSSTTPFTDDHSLVLTETTAKKYFGNDNPIGKTILVDDKESFQVTAVIKDLPRNSTLTADMFLPLSLFAKINYPPGKGRDFNTDFYEFNYATYLLLKPGTDLKALSTKIRNIHLRNKADDTDVAYLLQPMSKTHLYKSDGSRAGIETVQMFTIIALLILVIACINYVNLSTARSMLRSKEVSLRKIVGAARTQLFMQFIVETALLFLFAAILSVGMMYVLMPAFNSISGKELVLNFWSPEIWVVIGITIIATLAASSIYPALLLSSFEPLSALKGKISVRVSDAVFRKVLVVTQFAFSIILIAGTFIISKQLEYIRSKKLGYDKENVFAFYLRGMNEHYDAVRSEMLKQPGVVNVTKASGNIVQYQGQTGDNEWDGKAVGETFMVYPMAIDKEFIPFFNIKIKEGANYTGSKGDSARFIMNETAVQTLRLKDPIGKNFRLRGTKGTISAVVADFHFASMKQKIEPMVFYYNPGENGLMYVKIKGADASKAIATANQQWKRYNAGFEFNYSFLDETFNKVYSNEQRTGTLFNIFAAIAIVISCLGLFGLAAYTAQVRRREIGVRKVLGASVSGIISLLTFDFLKLVFISIALAVPVAWYAMSSWLQDFAYKISIGWTVFLFSGCIALGIAIITISFQSIRASLANPVKSLRTE